jgi:imidazolonepropionase-like amidohydrolase
VTTAPLRRAAGAALFVSACAGLAAADLAGPEKLAPETLLVRDATVWTQGPDGRLEGADLLVRDGKIAAIGRGLRAPSGAEVVDAAGRHVTPGLIDCHSHTAGRGGLNEGSENITAEVRIKDVIDPGDIDIYRQLAGGLTAAHVLHGSANSIGGQDAVIKLRWNATRDDLIMDGVPEGIKFALGENPKRSNFRNLPIPQRYPNTRMGVNESIRKVFRQALDYRREWESYRAASPKDRQHREPPRRDLRLEAILEILEGKRLIHSHSYRQDEILALLRLAEDFGVRIATFQHVLEGYKVADELAAHGAGASTFSDWWAYKLEAYDAIPYNGALMHDRGVLVTFNSDSSELARRMNLEAAKAVKYGDVDEQAALGFVTLNAAKQLGIDDRIGSLEKGKDADFVIWSGDPLSVYSVVEQTWVEGVREFDRKADLRWREEIARAREETIERIRNGDRKPEATDEAGEAAAAGEEESAPTAPHTDREETMAAAPTAPETREADEAGATPAPEARPSRYVDRLAGAGGKVSIVNATIHTITDGTISGGTVSFDEGRIAEVVPGAHPLPGAAVIDAAGKHVYPGFIDANTVLGLTEIGSVSGSVDIREIGDVNPQVNTAIAVNPDSELIPVTRANGLTHALTVPGGGLVRGTSSLIRLDGWTWEDLTATSPVAMHVSWPSFRIRTFSYSGTPPSREDQEKQREERLERIREAFADARAYRRARASARGGGRALDHDPALEAMLPVLDGDVPVIVHASEIRQIRSAVEWAEEEGLRLVLAGAGDMWRVADLLAEKDIPVLLTGVLSLPTRRDEPYDTPYVAAARLHRAGVRFAFAGSGGGFGAANARNLPYHAAMAVAFGLPRDEALRALTLRPAEILGLDHALGSIEPGKSASLMIADGDPLEIRTQVERLFIDGREADLGRSKHYRLYQRYASRPTADASRGADETR